MRRTRMVAPVAATLSVALLAAGCGGGSGGVTKKTGTLEDPIVVQWGEPENPLVPTNTTEVNGGNVLDPLFTGLVEYDPKTFKPHNAMAKSIELSPDKKTYTVKLKEGWKFHNGEEVTADNFVRAWNYGAYASNGQLTASFFSKIQGYDEVHPSDPDGDSGPKKPPKPTAEKMSGLKVVDDHTFTITLEKPFTIFPTTLGYSAFAPMPDVFFKDKAKYEKTPIGNGPFKFEKRTPKQSLTVTSYDKYKGEDKAQVDAVKFKVYKKLTTAYQDLKSGNLDVQRQVPTSALIGGRWKEELGDNAIQRDGMITGTLSFPLYKEKFQDPNLRKALSMAVDREKIMKNVFSGSREAMHEWAAPSVDGFEAGRCGQWCTYNPAKAKEYLKKAGGFQGTLTISSNADGSHQEWVKAVAGSIRDTLGIKVAFKPVPTFSEFREKVNSHKMSGLFRTGWVADYPNIETFLGPLYSTGGSSNDSGYSSPAFDKAMQQASSASSVKQANELYGQAADVLSKDMPVIPIYSQPVQAGKSDRVATATMTPRRSLALTTLTVAKPKE